MYNWPFSDLEHFYYTWFALSYSETISFGVVVKSTIRAFRKHVLYILYLYSFLYITRASKCQKMTKSYVFTLFSFFPNHPVNFQATLLQSCQVELFSILIPKNQYFAEEIRIFPRGNNMTKKMYIFLYFH